MANQEEFVDKAMYNTYLIVTKRKTFDDILDKDEEAYFIFNAIEENKDIDNDIIDTLIEHYEYSEEYEKCAELISIKKRGAKSSSSKS